MEGIAVIAFGEDVLKGEDAAGLDGGEAVFLADAVNSLV